MRGFVEGSVSLSCRALPTSLGVLLLLLQGGKSPEGVSGRLGFYATR